MGQIPRDEHRVNLVRQRANRLDHRFEVWNRVNPVLVRPDVEVAELSEEDWLSHSEVQVEAQRSADDAARGFAIAICALRQRLSKLGIETNRLHAGRG